MPAMYLLQNLPQRITDSNGNVCPGAKLYTYVTGTTTPKLAYTDQAGTIPHTNPVVADIGGQLPQVWLDSDSEYRIVVTKSDGTSLFSWDDVSSGMIAADLMDANDAAKGAGQVAYASLAYAPGTVGAKLGEWISVRDFGAKGDGSTDDTAAFVAAETAALAQGRQLHVPSGTYCINGQWTVRVHVHGYGATIKQTQASVSSSNAFGTVTIAADDITINGLSVDAGLKTSGFTGDGKSRLTLRDCKASNCVNLGFGFYGGTDVVLWNCRASNVRYAVTPSTGEPADPFFFGGCTRSRWISCVAEDFRRIGFVADANGSTKCQQIQAIFCTARNANNCDDSTTEYNGGFWAENTNSVDWLYCVATDIAGNAGQTSGRVVGLWALGGGNNSRGSISVIGCRVFGGSGYMPNGIAITGSGTFADVVVADCYVSKARTGLMTGCGLNSLTIRNFTMEDIVNTNGSQGGVLIDGTTATVNILEIEKITATNATWHADAGAINFFAAPSGCRYTLRNVKGALPHVMRGSVARLRTEECEIACGAGSGFSSFLASYVEHIDPVFTSRNSANTDFIVNGGALAASSEVVFRGGTVTGFGSGWSPEFSGDSITVRAYGTKFSNFCWQISTTGTFVNRFVTCEFYQVPATIGCIRTNFAAATKQVLIVQDCYFESANAADTPIRLWNSAPTNAVLQGNTRKTATNLHSLGSVTSDVNNVAV